jgi:hypothetical protein
MLWHVTPAQIEAGSGDPTPLPMAPEIEYKSDTNLNGIVALDAHRLLAVRSLDGTPTTTTAGKIEDPSFRSPSTVAKADGRHLVVNADFSKSRSPFTVSSVAI